ncbi:MAG TPA: hypothetical protein EYQ34_02895 [Acidimicrobiia bacterium]|jgi:hypothetical protein|nr:hypothetical protein [Acidimicrobiia bacterium]
MTVIRLDRELLVLPVLNAVAAIIYGLILWIVASSLGADLSGNSGGGGQGMIAVGVFGLLGMNVINTFFKGALVAGAHERFTGGDPTIGSSISGAASRLHRLLPWALLATTVGIVMSIIERQGGQLGRIARGMFNMAWGVITFLILPVIMFDDLGPIAGLKRSGQLLRTSWGENLTAQVGFGLLTVLMAAPGIILIAVGASSGFWPLLIIGVLAVMFAMVVAAALNGIFQTALYLFVTTGSAPEGFGEQQLTSSFNEKPYR